MSWYGNVMIALVLSMIIVLMIVFFAKKTR